MAFEQDVVNAYQKWRTEQVKIPLTAENREFKKKLFTGMGKLRGELIKFAKVFDKEIVNAKEVTSDKAKEMRDIMFKDFLNKIAELRNFIDLEDMYADASKKYGSAECTKWGERTIEPFSVIARCNVATWRNLYLFFCDIKKTFGKTRFLKSPETKELFHDKDVLLEQVYDFFHSIFKSMEKISLELLKKIKIEEHKIEAKDEDFFETKDSDESDDDAMSKSGKYRIGDAPEGIKIFPTDKSPSPNEVKQAGIGDCYLQSTLIALAKNNKKAITDCFVQGIKDIDKHNKITIRFYKYDEEKNAYKQVKIDVDKRKVVMPKETKDSALWPKLIEKAFIVYESTINNRKNISGGNESQIFEIMTGNIAKFKPSENTRKLFTEGNKIIKSIKSKLNHGKKLSCRFKHSFFAKDIISRKHILLSNSTTYHIGLMEKDDPHNTRNEDYITLNTKDQSVSMDIYDFCINYSKINEEFTRFESGLVDIPKIKSKLKDGKKVFCRFKDRFQSVDIRNHRTESFSTYDQYAIKEVHDEGKSNFVILNNGYWDFAMGIDDFLRNCGKIKYEKLPETEIKLESEAEPGLMSRIRSALWGSEKNQIPTKEPEVISKIRSFLKKGRMVTCKFIDNFYILDVVEKNKRKFISSVPTYQITALKEKDDPNNTIGKNYVVLIRVNVTTGNDDIVAMRIEDFCNNYSKIRYATQTKPQTNTEKKSDPHKEPDVISKIRSVLKKDKSITCSFIHDFNVKDAKYNGEMVPIQSKHGYAIVGINEEQKYIRLIEPNKFFGRTKTAIVNTERREPLKEGGHIAMSFNDFADNYFGITYGKA